MKNLKKIITKVSETKSWFFENVKLINLQSDSSRVAKRRLVNKIRNERQEVTTDVTDIFHQSLVMCKRDVLWKEEGKLVMRTEVDSLEYISLFIRCSLFLWNFKNFRGIEESFHAIATTWI